jgi:hypothetical protein
MQHRITAACQNDRPQHRRFPQFPSNRRSFCDILTSECAAPDVERATDVGT